MVGFTLKFDTDIQSATYGKFVVTDTTDYAGLGINPANVAGAITLTYPDGQQRIGNTSNPDIDPSVSLVDSALSIPLDVNAAFLQGTYVVKYEILVSGNVLPGTFSLSKTFEYCKQLPTTPSLDVEVDCLCAKLTVTDNTSLGNYTSVSRVYTVTPPPNQGLTAQAFAAKSFTYQLQFTGTHTIEANIATQYTPATGVTIAERLVYTNWEVPVVCHIDVCGLMSCLDKFNTKIDTLASNYGGYDKLPLELKDTREKLALWLINFSNAAKCGEGALATKYYDKIKGVLNCDCGCSSTSDGVVPLVPLCGSGSSVNIVLTSGNGINVVGTTVGQTTTYVVNVSASLLSQINQNSTDITTLNNTIANLPPQQYYKLTDESYIGDVGTIANNSEQTLRTFTLTAAGNPDDTFEIGDTMKITVSGTFASGDYGDKYVKIYAGSAVFSTPIVKNVYAAIIENGIEFRQGDFLIETWIESKGDGDQRIYTLMDGTYNYFQPVYSDTIDFTTSQVIRATAATASSLANGIILKTFKIELYKSA